MVPTETRGENRAQHKSLGKVWETFPKGARNSLKLKQMNIVTFVEKVGLKSKTMIESNKVKKIQNKSLS